jgi:hypothetical protein
MLASDDQLLSDAQYSVIGNIAQSEIGIVARPDDNGAVYKCAATNAAITTPLYDTVTLTVLCEYYKLAVEHLFVCLCVEGYFFIVSFVQHLCCFHATIFPFLH